MTIANKFVRLCDKYLQTVFAILFLNYALSANSQSNSNDDYSKFFLSINAGFNTQLGTASSKINDDYIVPYSKTGINPSLEAAYFISKNFGIGVNTCLFVAKEDETTVSEYTKQTFDYQVFVLKESSFDEYAHYIGPALFARCFFGDNWMIMTNVGAGLLYNKISDGIRKETYYSPSSVDLILPGDLPEDVNGRYVFTNKALGLHCSAGIHYRISRIFGVGLRASGLFSKYNMLPDDNNSKRCVNRIGLSAAFDFCF